MFQQPEKRKKIHTPVMRLLGNSSYSYSLIIIIIIIVLFVSLPISLIFFICCVWFCLFVSLSFDSFQFQSAFDSSSRVKDSDSDYSDFNRVFVFFGCLRKNKQNKILVIVVVIIVVIFHSCFYNFFFLVTIF